MKPGKRFRIRYLPNETEIDVDPAKLPYGETGLPGSVLDVALAHGVDIEHVCGGNIACSTCHVHVLEGLETCSPPGADELDQLADARGVTPQSRLSCQCVASGEKDLVVRIIGSGM